MVWIFTGPIMKGEKHETRKMLSRARKGSLHAPPHLLECGDHGVDPLDARRLKAFQHA